MKGIIYPSDTDVSWKIELNICEQQSPARWPQGAIGLENLQNEEAPAACESCPIVCFDRVDDWWGKEHA